MDCRLAMHIKQTQHLTLPFTWATWKSLQLKHDILEKEKEMGINKHVSN